MSILDTNYNFSAHEQIYLQNILLKHELGPLLAKNILGTRPKFTAIELLEINPIDGSTESLSLEVYFNSDVGSFKSLLTYTKFSSETALHEYLLLNNWLKTRFKDNSKIKIPEIFAYDEHYIISEGVRREILANSPLSLLNKATIAGEVLSTFHSTENHRANPKKYSALLTKSISSLRLNENGKEKLLSLGNTLLHNLNFFNSGVYGFGNFDTDHILIESNRNSILIDPVFVQYSKNVDRFEDIANFFVSTALEEFKKYHHIKDTLLALRTFFRSYNGYLRLFGTSLENIYDSENIYTAFYFHLGLIALIKSFFSSSSNSSRDKELNASSEKRLLEICNFISYIWTKGVMLLHEECFPVEFKENRINDQGWTVSWVTVGKSFLESIKKDLHFQIIYHRLPSTKNFFLKDAVRYWNLKNVKELKEIIKELNSWFSEEIVTITNDQLIYNEEMITSYDLVLNLSNWSEISKNLKEVYYKKPDHLIIRDLIKREIIEKNELNKGLDLDKKDLKNSLKRLIKDKKVIKIKNSYALNPNWEISLSIRARETLRFD